ncbi:MAG: PQQ-binding-like beta-propeller repeat protein [Pirellula sp.]
MDSQSKHLPTRWQSRRQTASRWLWWLALAALAMLFVSRAAFYETDHQIANLAGILWGLIASVLGFLGLWLSRSFSMKSKLLISAIPVACVGLFYLCFEYAGVTGEVLPSYRLRSFLRSKPPVRPQRPQIDSVEIPQEIKAYRFSQYLGNDRNGVVHEPLFSVAWDKKLPKELWRRPIGAGWSGFAIADGIAVTLEQVDEQESLTALSLVDGQTLWQVKRPGRHFHALGGLGPRSTPTIVSLEGKQIVVALSATGHLLCTELQTGVVRWEHQLLDVSESAQAEFEAAVNWGRAASPLVYNQTVFVPLGGAQNKIKGSLMACSLADGKIEWIQGDSQISYASPALMNLHGIEQIVSVNEGTVTGHGIEDGRVLWSTSWPSNSNGAACASQPVSVEGNRILVGKGYTQGSKLFEVQLEDKTSWSTKDIWAINKVLKTKFTSSIYYEGKLYGLSDGILECIDPADGSRIWRGGRYGQGQALMVNGTLVISSEDGQIVAVDRATGKPLGQMQVLEGVTWNTFAVAGPLLLARNATETVCLSSELENQ